MSTNNAWDFEVKYEIADQLLNCNCTEYTKEAEGFIEDVVEVLGNGDFAMKGAMHDELFTICDATQEITLCTKLSYIPTFRV